MDAFERITRICSIIECSGWGNNGRNPPSVYLNSDLLKKHFTDCDWRDDNKEPNFKKKWIGSYQGWQADGDTPEEAAENLEKEVVKRISAWCDKRFEEARKNMNGLIIAKKSILESLGQAGEGGGQNA